jgi:hypothetical protein
MHEILDYLIFYKYEHKNQARLSSKVTLNQLLIYEKNAND